MARLILSSCLGLVLLGSASAIAEPSPGSDLSGVYACEGTNPDGSAYTAVVEIVKRQDTYLVRWTQENEEQVMGVGPDFLACWPSVISEVLRQLWCIPWRRKGG